MNQKQTAVVFMCALSVFASCKQNPYHDLPLDNGVLEPTTPPEPRPVPPPYTIEVPSDLLDFEEGTAKSYKLVGHVPKGEAKLSFETLPAGANYDAAKGELVWKPSFADGNNPSEPTARSRVYPVKVTLRSTDDTKISVVRDIKLIVRNTLQGFKFESTPSISTIKERVQFNQTVKITNADYPNGPFQVSHNTLPAGASLVVDPAKPNLVTLSFMPDPTFTKLTGEALGLPETTFVKCQVTNGQCRKVEWTLKAADPAGYMIELPLVWEIEDVRQEPLVSAPASLIEDLEVLFNVTVTDMNGESAPVLSMPKAPASGSVALKDVSATAGAGRTDMSVWQVSWTGLPPEWAGTKQKLDLSACVGTTCKAHSVAIEFKGGAHAAPQIDRASWAFGARQFLKVGGTMKVPVTVKDGEGNPNAPGVRIEPASMANEVAWVNGELNLKAQTVGLKSFVVLATSAYGVVSASSFLYEVLPANWAATVIVGKVNSPEANEWLVVTGNKADMIPMETINDERQLALRDTVILTTAVIQNASALATVEAMTDKVKNVVIASPLLADLNGKLESELTTRGLKVKGRVNQLGLPAFDKWGVLTKSTTITKLVNATTLKGSLTNESSNPAVLTVDANSQCVKLLNIETALPLAEVVTVRCPRGAAGAGTLIVSGVEWGDLNLTGNDTAAPASWFKTILGL